MVIYCYLCGKKQFKGRLQLAMHKFPKNEQLRSLWVEACGLTKVDDVSTIKICSSHFHAKDYLEPMSKILGNHLRLKPGVVPSVRVPNIVSVLNSADHFQSDINDVGIVEEIVETSYSNLDNHEDIPFVPSNCELFVSQETEKSDNFTPKHSIELYQVIENSPEIHEDHLYSTPFNRNYPETQYSCETEKSDGILPQQHTSEISELTVNTLCLDGAHAYAGPRKRKFVEPRFVSEVELYDLINPQIAARTLKFIKNTNAKKTSKIKLLQGKVSRLQKQIQRFKDIIAREKQEKAERNENNIMDALPDNIKNIVSRKVTNGRYSDELKNFALTLNSYSPKAYNYVRKFWGKLLPHPSTIKEWHKDNRKSSEMPKDITDAISEEVLNVEDVIDETAINEEIILPYQKDELEDICEDDEFVSDNDPLTFYAVDSQHRRIEN